MTIELFDIAPTMQRKKNNQTTKNQAHTIILVMLSFAMAQRSPCKFKARLLVI
jgi:hypothetical protein